MQHRTGFGLFRAPRATDSPAGRPASFLRLRDSSGRDQGHSLAARGSRSDADMSEGDLTSQARSEQLESSQRRVELLLASERQARQRLEREGAEREELLALVSHELRNSLHSVLSWSQVMQDSTQLDECQQALRVIERSGRLMAMLTDDLLERASLLRAPRPLQRQPVALTLLLERLLVSLEPLRRPADIRVSFERSAEAEVWVLGDELRLTQAFLNLLSNALKFTPGGGCIDVRVGADRGWAVVHVRDSGQGIAREHLGQIFQESYQGEEPARPSSRGLGLGLAVVKHLVGAHHGTVEAWSAGEGQGATFEVRLPLAPGAPSAPG